MASGSGGGSSSAGGKNLTRTRSLYTSSNDYDKNHNQMTVSSSQFPNGSSSDKTRGNTQAGNSQISRTRSLSPDSRALERGKNRGGGSGRTDDMTTSTSLQHQSSSSVHSSATATAVGGETHGRSSGTEATMVTNIPTEGRKVVATLIHTPTLSHKHYSCSNIVPIDLTSSPFYMHFTSSSSTTLLISPMFFLSFSLVSFQP